MSGRPARTWASVLDELDARLDAAERGEHDLVGGWLPPAALGSPSGEERTRAERLLARHQAVLLALEAQRDARGVTVARMRRSEFHAPRPAPVYVNRDA